MGIRLTKEWTVTPIVRLPAGTVAAGLQARFVVRLDDLAPKQTQHRTNDPSLVRVSTGQQDQLTLRLLDLRRQRRLHLGFRRRVNAGQENRERSPLVNLGFNVDTATHVVHDTVDDRQTQACALASGLCREIGFENAG